MAISARVLRIDGTRALSSSDFDGREVDYPFGELDALVPAYATTIHKSQGSEYPAVVITLATQHYTMLARNLVYTAVTRGKRLVVIVGQKRALAIAVRNARTETTVDETAGMAGAIRRRHRINPPRKRQARRAGSSGFASSSQRHKLPPDGKARSTMATPGSG